MAHAGVKTFILLHGVADPEDLFYEELFRSAARRYVPCLSKSNKAKSCFQGRVTEYIKNELPRKAYDFYLCGRGEMVRDVTLLVDDLFPDSLVYSEIFY